MTRIQAPPTVSVQDFGDSRWAVVAEVLLLVLGLAVAGLGILFIAQGLAFDEPGLPGFGTFVVVLGVVIVVVGILHVVAAAYIWRHQSWARALGLILALLGAILGALVLPAAFSPAFTTGSQGELINVGPDLTSILIGLSVVPYLLVVVGLVLGGRHFRKRHDEVGQT